jgi:pimeloyl-ACP methyl ester carboxylesterase
MGGQVVLEVAASHPDLARAVVLIDAAPIVAGSPAVEMASDIGASLGGPDGETARATLVDHAVMALERMPEVQQQVRADMLRTPHHVAVSCVTLMGEWDGEAAARACIVPVLHVGAEDPINDAAALRALNPLIRTGQTVGAGHFNQLEVPEQVNLMIERFLAVAVE